MPTSNLPQPTPSDIHSEKLKSLRKALSKKDLDAFIIPRTDMYRGEFLADRDQRLQWLTGFSGSAGSCVVTHSSAAIFVDGRYNLQVHNEVDTEFFKVCRLPKETKSKWISENLKHDSVVGYDGLLHTLNEIRELSKRLSGKGIRLRDVDNPIDGIWDNQPEPPEGKIDPYRIEFAGETPESKIQRISETTGKPGDWSIVLTQPTSISWLLNIRGSDVLHVPVPHVLAILHSSGSVELFSKEINIAGNEESRISSRIEFRPMNSFESRVRALEGTVFIDASSIPYRFVDFLTHSKVKTVEKSDPCQKAKAIKNKVEINGARRAHLRDALAMVKVMSRLDATRKADITELDVADMLEEARASANKFMGLSFGTIAAAGPNAAIVHYRPKPLTNRRVEDSSLLLIDSGGHYLDGTTDVTRTICIGTPNTRIRELYTAVLKGLISLTLARWPTGKSGHQLDALARYHLWQLGADYDHGTGHGVGHYLEVHESPPSLSNSLSGPLEPGMITSIEPGVYQEDKFGIRIENLVLVQSVAADRNYQNREMLEFETLTHVPLDRRLIERRLLDERELNWLNAYHTEILKKLSKLDIDERTRTWLKTACQPL